MIILGSSEAPIVLGVSKYSTPWLLWANKVGLIPRVDDPDELARAGTKLQDVVLDMELEEMGIEPKLVWRQMRRRREFQRATPDGSYTDLDGGEATEPTMLFEVKCLAGHPPPVPRVADVVQCLHQLIVFEDADHVRLIYFGGLRRERFIIPRHQAAMDRVLRAEEHFLTLVETETPPPVQAEDAESLWRGWPFVKDETRVLGPEAIEWDRAMVEADHARTLAEHAYQENRAKIKAALGDAMRGVLPDGTRYTWRPDKRGIRALKRKGRDGE